MKVLACLILALGMTLPAAARAGDAEAPKRRPPAATPAPASSVSATAAAPATQPAAASTAVPAGADTPAGAPARPGSARTMDRLELDRTTIKGSQELPRVMYVVPWKHAELGELGGRPVNSLLDEVLAPVDRDEFRREVAYHAAIDPDRPAAPPQ